MEAKNNQLEFFVSFNKCYCSLLNSFILYFFLNKVLFQFIFKWYGLYFFK